MSGEGRLSGKLAEAIGVHSGHRHGKTTELVERCANAAEMGVKVAYLSRQDPMDLAERIMARDGASLIEHRSARGKLQSTIVQFKGGGEVLFTNSRQKAARLGIDEFMTDYDADVG